MSKKLLNVIFIVVCTALFAFIILMASLVFNLLRSEKETITDMEQYESILGKEGKYKKNYLGYNDIFPDCVPDSADIEDFYYEYYNPWDGNYLGYLVYTCDAEEYESEYERLSQLDRIADYEVYGITGFPYELCAVDADDYSGVRYALADREARRFIYVELAFCNYFTDIEYQKIVEEKYLPIGFDATIGNPVESAQDTKKN